MFVRRAAWHSRRHGLIEERHREVPEIEQTRLNAELSINSGYVGSVPPTISPDALQRMRALPDVDGVAGYAFEPAKVNGEGSTSA